jgi:competence protein ComEC
MKRWLLLCLMLLAGCVEVAVETPSELPASDQSFTGSIKIAMLDIGQGQAILLFFPNMTVLYDGGPRGRLAQYLEDFNVSTIDLAIISNRDADHSGGLIGGFDIVNVGAYAIPDVPCETKTCADLETKAIAEGSERPNLVDGEVINVGPGMTLQILNPDSPPQFSGDNENSIVIKLTYGNFTALFPGDCQSGCENALIDEYGNQLQSDVYIAGHHGSKTSSTQPFVTAINPTASLISVGENNQYHHPAPEVVERLNTTGNAYRTDQHGTLIVESDGSAFTVSDANGLLLWAKA